MKEKRSLFKMIFGTSRQPPQQQTYMQMLNSSPNFYDFSGESYDSDTVRATVDAFARNVGKLKAKHIRRVNGEVRNTNSEIEWLLQVRPNKFMNAYIFYYRLATQYLMSNNVFVWIRRKPGSNDVEGYYPLVSSGVELLDVAGEMVVRFRFYDGKEYLAPYEDIIHLRRFYFNNDMFGESNRKALTPILNLISVTNQGIANAVKTSAFLRGILKFTAMLKPEDMKKQTDKFAEDYLSAANNGGIAATDSKAEYQELKSDPKMIDDRQMSAMESKVHGYFGTNEKIVKSDYSESDWGAYYESMIEPFGLQMALEFTTKTFSGRAQGHGNEILFESNRLQYASNDTKVKIIETLVDRGMMSINQGLEVFNLPPIENGDKRIMSLNFIDAEMANDYQLGKVKSKTAGGGGEEK
ncbi:phage portal protein [Paenibacillus sp. IHBB 3054]|uniref:phage portal protein n=1 Tax=Paenibacillus sp. IHBB 3054 TaxID=3425689 RepID=UPI003F670447